MKQLWQKLMLLVVMSFVSPSVNAGVIYQGFTAPSGVPWLHDYGIDSIGGIYFGFTSDPSFATVRDFIPFAPKFPNVTIAGDATFLAVNAGFPNGLPPGLVFDEATSSATVNVPLGTVLTFTEGDPAGWRDYSTLYRDVNGIPTPFEEFRPVLGDGPDSFVLDEVGMIDLVAFSFFTGGIYPEPGAPSFPFLTHINVVPEPGTLALGVGLMGFVISRRCG